MLKKVRFNPLILLIPYLSFMFYRKPDLSDSFIIIGLICLYLCNKYLDSRYKEHVPEPEIQELQLEIEKTKAELALKAIKNQQVVEDHKFASMEATNDRKIMF